MSNNEEPNIKTEKADQDAIDQILEKLGPKAQKVREGLKKMEATSNHLKEFINSNKEFFNFYYGSSDVVQEEPQVRKAGNAKKNKKESKRKAENKNGKGEAKEEDCLVFQPKLIKNCTLKDYQVEGLNWLIALHKYNANGILADQMGLGKTVQAISFLAYLDQVEKIRGPHLIICPLSVATNWQREIEKFYPSCRTIMVGARRECREEQKQEYRANASEYNVIIATFDSILVNITFFRDISFYCIVVDEAHRMRNKNTIFSKEMARIKSNRRILLTGTPISNNVKELWSLLNFSLPKVFHSHDIFEEFFLTNLVKESNAAEQDLGEEAKIEKEFAAVKTEVYQEFVGTLHRILGPFMLRRLKHDTNLNLPPKTEVCLYCPLSNMQRNIYKLLVTSQAKGLGAEFCSGHILTELRKASIHPYLFPSMDCDEEYGEHLITNSGKFTVLDKLLQRLVVQQKNKILIFSQFATVLDILEDYLTYRNINFFRLDGRTSSYMRTSYMDQFNSSQQETLVFILTTRAGGLGINLISAHHVIILDSDWNPQMDMQAMDRAHRLGQKHPVTVFRLVSKDTIEERILQIQTMKLKLDYLIIERGRKVHENDKTFEMCTLTPQDMKDLTYFGANKIFKMQQDDDLANIDIDKLLEEGKRISEQTDEFLEDKKKEFTEKAT